MDLARAMREFDITVSVSKWFSLTAQRGSIVARPIKFASLYWAIMNVEGDLSAKGESKPAPAAMGKKAVNRELAKVSRLSGLCRCQTCPLEILLVDDNVVNVTVGRRILEMFGYRDVASALDGQQAIEAAEKKQYDLILLDLQMPVLDGFSAHKRIKGSPLAGEPCVVALTANADEVSQNSTSMPILMTCRRRRSSVSR
jgi:CheY-like chemotaxis protein